MATQHEIKFLKEVESILHAIPGVKGFRIGSHRIRVFVDNADVCLPNQIGPLPVVAEISIEGDS